MKRSKGASGALTLAASPFGAPPGEAVPDGACHRSLCAAVHAFVQARGMPNGLASLLMPLALPKGMRRYDSPLHEEALLQSVSSLSVKPKIPAAAAAILVSAFLGAGSALAHGENHAAKGASVKEQMPWGIAADPRPGLRTIRVSMSDAMRFSPASIAVREGETVRIIVKNEGKLMHEFVLGTRQTHDEHAALMVKFPNMEHDEPYMVHVPPGKSGTIVWTFNRAGAFGFACLIAGHYQAGMVGRIEVRTRRVSRAG